MAAGTTERRRELNKYRTSSWFCDRRSKQSKLKFCRNFESFIIIIFLFLDGVSLLSLLNSRY